VGADLAIVDAVPHGTTVTVRLAGGASESERPVVDGERVSV
jgi:hypothetical protein